MNLTEEELLTISDDVVRGDRDAETYRTHLRRALNDLNELSLAVQTHAQDHDRHRAMSAFIAVFWVSAAVVTAGLTVYWITRENATVAVLTALQAGAYLGIGIQHGNRSQEER